ncbi:MAG: hypothetical protein LBP86_10050 [Azoarcus sp.]|jgi:hypothetical protein|nr:hypothetical protein [Azoarcus sp.]
MKKPALFPLFHLAASLALGEASSAAMAASVIHSTAEASSEASYWQVEFNDSGGATTAVNVDSPSQWGNDVDWIANTASGINGHSPAYFDYSRTFDLSGDDPATAVPSFNRAWDTDFAGISLNGTSASGPLLAYPSFTFIPVTLPQGFADELNTIHPYATGDGVTDGFAFELLGFTATPLQSPRPGGTVSESVIGALLLGGIGILSMSMIGHRRKIASARG